MSEEISLDIRGIQEAQQKNLRKIATLKTSGALGAGIKLLGVGLHRYMVTITHVDTGALKSSHRFAMKTGSTPEGRIFIDQSAVNPNGQKPHRYGVYENARGGSHAFRDRTVKEAAPGLLKQVVAWVRNRFRSA